MLSPQVQSKIKMLEIATRRLVCGNFSGEFKTAARGSGFDFEQLSEYQPGDDTRFIDWNSTARANKLLIRQYREDRNRTVLILLDSSASTYFGSQNKLKIDVQKEIAAILLFASHFVQDATGLMIFSNDVHTNIPARSGRNHTNIMINQIFSCKPRGTTSLAQPLKNLMHNYPANMLVFIISDFIDMHYEKLLMAAAKKHDIVLVRVHDVREHSFPSVIVRLQDPETKQVVETSPSKISHLNNFLKNWHMHQKISFRQKGIDHCDIQCDSFSIDQLINFFKQRVMYL